MATNSAPSTIRQYLPFLGLAAVLIAVFFFVLPESVRTGSPHRIQALIGTFIFGALVGFSEIATRYRDEPMKAAMSPFGLIYLSLNGYLSILALCVIVHFPDTFGKAATDDFL